MNIFCSRERLTKGSSNSYVCHLRLSYIFSSHTHIFTLTHTHTSLHLSLSLSHTYIFTSSLTSSHSHLHILTSSLSLLFPLSFLSPFSLSRLLYLSLFRPRVVPAEESRNVNPFARNEGRCAKTEVKLQFYLCRICPGATLSHEMRVGAQKLRSNCDFTCAGLVPEQPFRTK